MDILDFLDELCKTLNRISEDFKPLDKYDFYNVDSIEDIDGYEDFQKYLEEHPIIREEKLKEAQETIDEEMAKAKDYRCVAFVDERLLELTLIMELANKRIDKINEQKIKYYDIIKKSLKKLYKVRSMLNETHIDIDKIRELINDLPVFNDFEELKNIKGKLMDKIEVYVDNKEAAYQEKQAQIQANIIAKQKEKEQLQELTNEIEEAPKLININNYELVETVLIDNYDLIGSMLVNPDYSNLLIENEIEELVNWPFININEEDCSIVIISILSLINNETNQDKINKYIDYLVKMCNKLEVYKFYEDVNKRSLDICNLNGLTEEEFNTIMMIQSKLASLPIDIQGDDEAYDELDKYNNIMSSFINKRKINVPTSDEKMKIKGFVLFDYQLDEFGNINPYITTDLDQSSKSSYIDGSIPKDKLEANGYQDFNDIIDDIILSGNPRVLNELTNDKINRCVRNVYKTTNGHELINTNKENSTGMVRIRPRRTSLVRFIDERVVVKPDNKNYSKIKELIESKFDNVELDESFNIYINMLSAFKNKETDCYTTSISRQDHSLIKKLLTKEELSNKDIELLSDIIDSSLIAFDRLKEINDLFNFTSINSMKRKGSSKR